MEKAALAELAGRAEPESPWLEQLASTGPEQAVPDFPAGTRLCHGRYEVQAQLGRGGMGVVYAAWDAERHERVALKTLTHSSPTSIYRIKQEFRGLQHVRHTNLVRLHELFEDAGRWCFTLELVPGQTLLRGLKGAPLDGIRTALQQLATGIGALHAAGKLHRDLKPSNVMLTPGGRVVILDFGLAEDIAPALAPAQVASRQSGTPGYMAPELGVSGATQASDWYAFGVIVWELLTGSLPYDSERGQSGPPNLPGSTTTLCSGSELDGRDSRLAPSPAGLDASGIPADLDELCRALLSVDPRERPSAAEVARRLQGLAMEARTERQLAPSNRSADDDLAPVISSSPRRLIGRGPELRWLREAYDACRRGSSPVVALVSGESGIGKTALVLSFLRKLEAPLLLCGRCYEREFVPYKAFDAAIDELCRHLVQLPAGELREILPPGFSALCRLFPVLGRAQPSATGLLLHDGDVHEIRRRGFEALGQLLGRISRSRPVVLWIDDLHWTDEDSTGLLLHLLRQPDAPNILLLATLRDGPGKHPRVSALYAALEDDVRLDVRQLILGPLSHDAAAALLAGVSPGAPAALIDGARGHPFLLEELSRHAARHAAERGGWPSLQEALESRIQELGDDERRVLELLALAGRPLAERLARAAAGPIWHDTLHALCDARLARRNGLDGTSSCYHDAIREAVVRVAPPERARRCHRSLASALLSSGQFSPEHLALHLVGSGHRLRGAEQMIVAARAAAASLAFERAAQLYERALELGRFRSAQARELSLARADSLSAAGHGSEAAALYLELLADDDDLNLELRIRAAEQYLLSGRLEQGLEQLGAALGALGLDLPASAHGAIASFAWQRLKIRLRGYDFEERLVQRDAARRLALLERAVVALIRLDPLRASELASRYLLLALESGSAAAISTAFIADFVIATLLRVSDAELRRKRERAELACERFGGIEQRAIMHSAFATAERLSPQPDLPAALAEFERFFDIHREHVLPRASYQRPWEEWGRSVVLCWQGEFARVARSARARVDEGWARGDHCIIPLWAGGEVFLARLATGDVAAAERDLMRALRIWSARHFTLQDLMLAIGAFYLERFRGNARGAFEVTEKALRRLEASPLRRMPNAIDTVQGMRGHAALDWACQCQDRATRRELWRLARRIRRAPGKRPNLAALTRSYLLDAACHYQARERERAEQALAQAEAHLKSIPLYANAVRHRRGALRGGAEGALWMAEARRFSSDRGTLEPERIFDLLLPGYAATP